jgi:2-polyprenyl-3-methyl-5-hydroxy-6-metoxy-1,4-benzoquinol methylase
MTKTYGVRDYDQYWINRIAQRGISDKFGARHHAIVSLVNKYLSPGKTILDFGIGQGKMIDSLTGRYQVYAVETSQVIIDQFSDRGMVIKKHNLNEGLCDFGVKFDFIIASYVLHHLESPEKLISQIPDHLNPSGYFLVCFPNVISLNKRMKFLRGKFPSFSGRHQNFLTPQEIGECCLKYFSLVETMTPRHVAGSRRLARLSPDLLAKEIIYLFQQRGN